MKKIFAAALCLLLALCLCACNFEMQTFDHTHDYTVVSNSEEHLEICKLCDHVRNRGPHKDGDGDGLCDFCEQPKQEEDPDLPAPHVHSYEWRHTQTEHWRECACGDVIEREAHDFGGGYVCECGFAKDAPPTAEQDPKNYYLVGNFGSAMNWQTEYREEFRFNRLETPDEQGLTVFVKEIELSAGFEFKIVNDGNPANFWENEISYRALRGGNAASMFTGEAAHDNIRLERGEGLFTLTLHTDRSDGSAAYFEADFAGEAPDPDHVHAFSQSWSYDEFTHWHAATCGHAVKEGEGAHVFAGNTCSVCGYTASEEPVDDDYAFGDDVSAQNDAFYKDYSAEEKALYYTLWEETTSVSIKVDIAPSELVKINEAFLSGDPVKQDTYRRCDLTLTVNGQEYFYDEVGIRMRGNTSRREFCDETGRIYAFVHFRFSFNETFDGSDYEGDAWGNDILHDWSSDPEGRKARKDRSFATMEKCYFKWNKNYDQTYIREIYANRMYRAYGILAPHITLTQFSVRQKDAFESFGVGNLYETVDKQFIKRNFDKTEKGGDLYKCTYTAQGPADLTRAYGYGIDDGFTYALKTNDDPADFNEHRYLLALIGALNAPADRFETELESILDMKYFARYEAVNYFVGDPDSIRNNYNNYYLYFTPAGKAYFIPYDYDRGFGVTQDWNPSGNGMTGATPFDMRAYGAGENNRSPLYTRTILPGGNANYQALYRDRLRMILRGEWMTYSQFQTLYDAYRTLYSDMVTPSDVIVRQCGGNLNVNKLAFSESDSNLPVREYFAAKTATAKSALAS